ncbi:hypothetical protein [Streptomyces yerevanensis]|uniref:hypothetical protein n=1 Tax=Streptomyces yerevanensis TaxID=66378 RepID=UPI0005263419|nr:hypothetical protein [Streptomyces yerevanensis]
MTTDPDALRAMSDRERLAALTSLSPVELAKLKANMTAAGAAAERQHGPMQRVSPWELDPPDVELDD